MIFTEGSRNSEFSESNIYDATETREEEDLAMKALFSFILFISAFSCLALSQRQQLTFLIVPCYNEEQRLPVERFHKFASDPANKNIRIVFVNDGSTDGTLDVLHKLANQHRDKMDVLSASQNGGKAEAVRQGMRHVLNNANATSDDLVGFWDADLATPLETVNKFVTVFQEHPGIEMVFGARVALLGKNIQRKAYRHYLGRVFATLASMILNLRIYDTQCGAKLFKATADLNTTLSKPFLTKWIFDVELIARFIALRSGTDKPPCENIIYEYPLDVWEDVTGSKLAFGSMIWALYGLVYIWFEHFGPGPDVFAVGTTLFLIFGSTILLNQCVKRWMK